MAPHPATFTTTEIPPSPAMRLIPTACPLIRDVWLPPSVTLIPVGWLPFGDESGGTWYLAGAAALSLPHLERGGLVIVPSAFVEPHLDWPFDEVRLIELGRRIAEGKRIPRAPMASFLRHDYPDPAATERRGQRGHSWDLVGALNRRFDLLEADSSAWADAPVPHLQHLLRTGPWQLLAPQALKAARAFIGAPPALLDDDAAAMAAVALAKHHGRTGAHRTGRRRSLPVPDMETSLLRTLLALREGDVEFPAEKVYNCLAPKGRPWFRVREKVKRGDTRALDESVEAMAVPFPAEASCPAIPWPEHDDDVLALNDARRALQSHDVEGALRHVGELSASWRHFCGEAVTTWLRSSAFARHLMLLCGGEPARFQPVGG